MKRFILWILAVILVGLILAATGSIPPDSGNDWAWVFTVLGSFVIIIFLERNANQKLFFDVLLTAIILSAIGFFVIGYFVLGPP